VVGPPRDQARPLRSHPVPEPATYPPPGHVLRDLAIDVEHRDEGSARGWITVTPHVAGPDGGALAGVLATLVDVVAGSVAARAARPDWMATADLALQLARPATGPEVEAQGRLVRKGRTTIVVEVRLSDGQGPGSLGWASATFSVLEQRPGTPVLDQLPERGQRARVGGDDGSRLGRPLAEAAGITARDGALVLDTGPYVHNSFGAVQGGMMALLGDLAGAQALGATLGPASTVDLQVAYLALGRVGPIAARAEILSAESGRGSAVVRLVDEGAGDRLTTIVQVVARSEDGP
jgi:uncharacterized protein (TIGR00369 family)